MKNGLSSGEGLIAQFSETADKRLLAVEGEYGSILRVMQRRGSTLSPVIRSAWDGTDLNILTKRAPISVSGAHVSVIGHITRDELLTYIDDSDLWNGCANRFLWCHARRARFLAHGGNSNPAVLQPLLVRLKGAIASAQRFKGRALTWDPNAAKEWERIYPQLSRATAGLLGSVTARGEAQVVRIALIYALLDCSDSIRVEHLRAAQAVWRYCFSSAQFIFGHGLGNRVAKAILNMLAESYAGLTRTEISNGLGRHQQQSKIDAALALLLDSGRAKRQTEKSGGRPIERWFAIGVDDDPSIPKSRGYYFDTRTFVDEAES